MKASEQYRLRVFFNQLVDGIKFQLVDGMLNTIYDGVGMELNLNVAQGIYHLKISYIDYFQEKYFSVSGNTELKLDFDYPFTVPALNYKTTHEYYSLDAERYSLEATLGAKGHQPNFFFFAALYCTEKPSPIPASKWLDSYTLFNIERSVDLKFNTSNSSYDDNVGKVYFSTFLQPGLYFLTYASTSIQRIFPFYIFNKYQTQFFIRYSDLPDFVNCRMFYSDAGCFKESAIEYLLLEKIICTFSDFKNFQLITSEEIENIKRFPYLVALVDLLFLTLPLHIARLYNSSNLLSPVKGCKRLDLPDLVYGRNDQFDVYPYSDKPPLLSFIFARYAHRHDDGQLLFEPASILDRIVDNLHYDLFWTNFSRIEEPDNWTKAYRPLLRTINESSNPIIRTVAKARYAVLDFWNPQFDDNLKYLVGKTSLTEEQVESLTKVLSEIKDVSMMSKEFGLPPTTILRNYQKYTGYYIQIREPNSNKNLNKAEGSRFTTIIIMVCTTLILSIGSYLILNWPQNNQTAWETTSGMPGNRESQVDRNIALINDSSSSVVDFNAKKVRYQEDSFKRDSDRSLVHYNPYISIRTWDTLAKYKDLSDLLSDYELTGVKLAQSRYNYETATDFLKINVKISEMLKSDSDYLAPYLEHGDIDSLNKLLVRYISFYESIPTSLKLTDKQTYWKTPKETLISSEIKEKLDRASFLIQNKAELKEQFYFSELQNLKMQKSQ